jgi:hypothetical protein
VDVADIVLAVELIVGFLVIAALLLWRWPRS